jgi:protein TonB
MIEPEPTAPEASAPSIAELVFAGEARSGGWRIAVAGFVVTLLYIGVLAIVSGLGQSAGPWSAEMAARVHDAIATERAVDMTPPPPPPPASSSAKAASTVMPARVARAPRASHPAPSAPAQAGKIVAAASLPADFTGLSFVVGSGSSYAGGTTTAKGTSHAPVDGPVAPDGVAKATSARDRSRAVALDEAAWSCPWPAEADAQQVNEQTVVLRVAVRADGRAERVDVLSDPGFGFGAAARSCALATRFEAARDSSGQPIAASSPPIRVHFFR